MCGGDERTSVSLNKEGEGGGGRRDWLTNREKGLVCPSSSRGDGCRFPSVLNALHAAISRWRKTRDYFLGVLANEHFFRANALSISLFLLVKG